MKNEVMEWAIGHFGENLVLIAPNVCAKVTGISRNEKNGKDTLTIEHATGKVKYDDSDVVRTVDTEDYVFRIKHTGSWYCLVTEAYCKKKESEGILAQDIVGEILESIAEPAPENDTIKVHTVTDKFGVERETLYIATDNEVINKYFADMKNTPLGMVFTSNTNHNQGVDECEESNDKSQVESMVVLPMDSPCPDIAEGCPLIMDIDEEDKAVIAPTPWMLKKDNNKKGDIPVCYVINDACRGIIFPYLEYSFEEMEALVQNIVGEILESIAKPAPEPEPETTKAHTVVDKFGVERVPLYIDNDGNEVIDEYLADMKNIPLGIVYTLNTFSEVNHNHAVYDGVVEYVESNDKPQIESGVVLSMHATCPDIPEGCPFIMSIDEKDKAVIAQTPWKKDDVPVCYIMSNTSRGIIFPYLVYSFDQMEALVQNYDRCAAMFRKDVDTQGLGNKYNKDVEKSVMDMLKGCVNSNNGFFHVEKKDITKITEDVLEELPETLEEVDIPVIIEEIPTLSEDDTKLVINSENRGKSGKISDKILSELLECWSDNISEEDVKDAKRMNANLEEVFSDASNDGEKCDSDTLSEEHLFRQMAEYIQDNKISSMTFYLNEDGSVHCETLLRAVYPAKN